jgi:hypothetical protein
LELGANPKDQIGAQIDWVHSQGKITPHLKEVAHKIRLGGNRGSHPPDKPEDDSPLTPEEADAGVSFYAALFQ